AAFLEHSTSSLGLAGVMDVLRHFRYLFTVTDQCSLCSQPAPDSETQSRASATMTDCGPAPAAPDTSTVFPSADSLPDQAPSGWLVRETCVPGGRSLGASALGSSAA